jgi:hypothetical protein
LARTTASGILDGVEGQLPLTLGLAEQVRAQGHPRLQLRVEPPQLLVLLLGDAQQPLVLRLERVLLERALDGEHQVAVVPRLGDEAENLRAVDGLSMACWSACPVSMMR